MTVREIIEQEQAEEKVKLQVYLCLIGYILANWEGKDANGHMKNKFKKLAEKDSTNPTMTMKEYIMDMKELIFRGGIVEANGLEQFSIYVYTDSSYSHKPRPVTAEWLAEANKPYSAGAPQRIEERDAILATDFPEKATTAINAVKESIEKCRETLSEIPYHKVPDHCAIENGMGIKALFRNERTDLDLWKLS